MITFDQLRQICPSISRNADVFIPYLNDTLARFDITTRPRIAAFLANILHESGGLHYVREIYGPTAQQKRYERDFKAAWPPTDNDNRNSLVYTLGNEHAGDGKLFLGRSFLQTTGRTNYRECGKALGLDLLSHPDLLETPQYACLAAGWFWDKHNLNQWADKPKEWRGEVHGKPVTNIEMCRYRINGGFNGMVSVQAYYDLAMDVL